MDAGELDFDQPGGALSCQLRGRGEPLIAALDRDLEGC